MSRCICPRNHGEKKEICKKRNLSALSGILGHFKSKFRKKREVVIFPITRSGRVKKSPKKKKNFFTRTFSLVVFLFPVIKNEKKVSGFVFFRKGRRKM